jgi:hypothetical protein
LGRGIEGRLLGFELFLGELVGGVELFGLQVGLGDVLGLL